MNSQIETIKKELFSFYQANDHCYVSPKENAVLFRNVQKIRALKNDLDPSFIYFLDSLHYLHEKEKIMPAHRKKLIDDIGFSWFEDIRKEDERRWEENYQDLLQFKEKNNHLIVPDIKLYQKLNSWIYRQRKEEGTMSKYHKKKLNDIGFRWKRNIRMDQTMAWNKMYEELKSFYNKYGHCRVTSYAKEYPQLKSWVDRHRKFWDKLDKKMRNKLEALNFAAPSGVEKGYRQQWINMLSKLKKFKNEIGHCRVPLKYEPNPSLGRWVHLQRLSEHKLADWKKRQLLALDFEWSSVIQDEKRNKWNEMYNRLVKFYERFGHSSVPGDWEEDSKLAKWVIYQRHSSKPLSKEKTDLLKQVKFDFKPNLDYRKRDEKGHFIKLTNIYYKNADSNAV